MRKFAVTVTLGRRTLLNAMHCWTDTEEIARQDGVQWAINHLVRQRTGWTPERVRNAVVVSVVDTGSN